MELANYTADGKRQAQLDKYSKIYVQYWSSDYDGGHNEGVITFTSIEDMDRWEKSRDEWGESADGPYGHTIVEPTEEFNHTYFTR